MDISIVILTWNSEKYIRQCIDSIVESFKNGNINYEIFVVDNGSQDNTVNIINMLSDKYPNNLTPILLERNYGTTISRNFALKKSKGKYICVIDSDVVVSGNVFNELMLALDSDATIGLTVPKIYYPNGKWQKSYDTFPTLLHKMKRFLFLRQIEGKESRLNSDESSLGKDIDYAISAFWMFKREIISKVGLLDEKIFYSPEDVDYCLRIWKSGYRIAYVPKVNIVHHTQEISRGWKISRAKLSHIKGLFYLFRKHRYLIFKPSFCKMYV
ncbi:MAG: glycosyltransferase family 2 protein [Geobacter sp.]|nr:MAG: glycosyltransferase family 2 protein [Geobacter sp.]